MPKMWEVLHELKNGKALKTETGSVYFNKDGEAWHANSGDINHYFKSSGVKLNQTCEVIDMPDELMTKVDFFEAMAALKAGKRVKSPYSGMVYFCKDGIAAYEDSDTEANFSTGEVSGNWLILN